MTTVVISLVKWQVYHFHEKCIIVTKNPKPLNVLIYDMKLKLTSAINLKEKIISDL